MSEPAKPLAPPPTGSLSLKGHMYNGVGTTGGPVPGATLTATADELQIKGNLGDFRIPRTAMTKLHRGSLYPWFFQGVRIRHRIASYPSTLLFQPMECSTRELLAQLRAMGFPTG